VGDDGFFRSRQAKAFLIVVTVFAALLGRLWYLQIIKGDVYANLADGNRRRLIRVAAARGNILDRNGKLVASNRTSFTVSAVPSGSKEMHAGVIEKLSKILNMEQAVIREKLEKGGVYPYEPVPLKRDVSAETVIAIEEQRWELPGIMIEKTPMRVYPAGELAAHVVGYLGEVSEQDLKRLGSENYRSSDLVGKTGLEHCFERELRGRDGAQHVEVNVLDRPVRILGESPAVPGKDLILTLDLDLQLAARESLRKQLRILHESDGERGLLRHGVVIALDPWTGEILALVSYPDYDPNVMSRSHIPFEYYRSIVEQGALFNYATQGLHQPGSVFKPLLAVAALAEHEVTAEEVYHADGYGPYGQLKCWVMNGPNPRPHGDITIVGALENSCNDFFWEMGTRLGIDRIAEYARYFGFGSTTGLRLTPAEKAGVVPDPGWKMRTFGKRWMPYETLFVSIGQYPVQVTPLQMACFYAALATKGRMYRPRLVNAVVSPDGRNEQTLEPELLRSIALPEEVWDTVSRGLEAVVRTGTAASAFSGFPWSAAGKTGSAEVDGRDPHAWFGGYAPADQPEIVVMVLLEHGKAGGRAAAPVAREVLEAYFRGKEQTSVQP